GCSEKVSDSEASIPNVSLNKQIPFSNGINDSDVSSATASSQTPAIGTDSSCASCPPCTTVSLCTPCTTLPHNASTTTSAESEDLIAKNWVYFKATNAWYKVLNNHSLWVRWERAESACIKEGGHLVSIHSDVENQFIYGLATGDHWCTHATIGLKSDANDEQNLHWSDFSLFDYQNWKNGTSPQFESNGDAYCGYMASDKWGPWDMFNCGNTYGLCAVCKTTNF
ncbi:Neurocan core protein, partial [Toxocara canis]